jgi:hypothetical protein
MRKNNHWVHGNVKLILPPLPKELLGSNGCFFQHAIFDQNIGKEVYLALLESQLSETFHSMKTVEMYCKNGVSRTIYGIIAFLLFSFYSAHEYISSYEMYLNPFDPGSIDLLSKLGQQTHLKLLVFDSYSDELRNFFEFENTYGFDKYLENLTKIIDDQSPVDFLKAKEEFMSKYTIEDLINMDV